MSGMHERDGWQVSPAQRVTGGLFTLMKVIIVAVVVLFAVRWALAEYYISTHCTTVLGTRVCH